MEAQFKFWWPADKFGGSAVKFWWHWSFYGQVLVVTVVCVCSVVVSVNNRHKNHPKKCLWWSYASLVVIWSLWK